MPFTLSSHTHVSAWHCQQSTTSFCASAVCGVPAALAAALVVAKLPKRLRKQQRQAYKELEERKQRHAKLDTLVRTFDTRKALQGKGRRRKVKDAEGDEPAQFKWKQDRKR